MIIRRFASSVSASTSKFSLPTNIRQLLDNASDSKDSATISGWIKSIRKQKNVSFAVITDGSTTKGLQAVLVKGKEDEILKKLTNGAAVRLTGQLVASPGSGQSHELLVDDKGHVEVLGECDPDTYPIQKKSLTAEYLRDHVHLRGRTTNIASMLRLRHDLRRRIDSWFEEQGFYHANTPIITANDCEGAGEAFRISPIQSSHPASSKITSNLATPPPSEFFGSPAYLTVSHQLHLEALATSISRVYTLSPCFRAEPSDTARHLAEFWMLEAEWAFPTPDGVHGVCNLTEGLLRAITQNIFETHDVGMLLSEASPPKTKALLEGFSSDKPWPRISYTEAVKELEAASGSGAVRFDYKPQWGRPLQSEHERWLSEIMVGGPVFVTDYPASFKPFYMRLNEDGKTVACFDLLVPYIGELAGGSVREERIEILKSQMREAGLFAPDDPTGENSPYSWYLNLRKFGGAPHAGFGMGFERLVGWLTGIDNIRECIPMPRWAGRMLL